MRPFGRPPGTPPRGFATRSVSRHERRPVLPFESWEQVEAVAAELEPRYAAIPIVAIGTGLRPEEWIGLHRADLDREAGLLHVRRRFTQGVLKDGGKTEGSVRSVPLRRRVLEALDAMPARIDTKILLPAPRAATSTSSDSGTGTGSLRYAPPGSSTGESMTVGIPSRPGRSRADELDLARPHHGHKRSRA